MVYESKYTWRSGHGKVPADVAGRVMEEIEARDGTVTKESFLDASRPEESPTHGCFEWDDSVAAEMYRLHQSSDCIRDLVITISSGDEKTKAPAFVKITEQGPVSAEYKSIGIAMNDDQDRQIVLKNALKELRAFQQKYNNLRHQNSQ